MDLTNKKFRKRKGTSGVSGQFYEIKLVMLFLLEAIRRKELKKIQSFYLASNIEEGQSFDDLVFTYQYVDIDGKVRNSIIFIQAKHRDKDEKKISINTLLSTCESGDFVLRKYLSSFIKIKQQFSQNSDHPVFQRNVEDCEFIIFTNATFDFNKSRGNVYKEFVEKEHFLNITENQNCYYKIAKTEEVTNVLKTSLDYEVVTKILAQSILSKTVDMNKPVMKDYHKPLAETVLKRINKSEGVIEERFFDDEYLEFRNAILSNLQKQKHFSGLTYDRLRNHILATRIQLPEKFGVTAEDDLKASLPQKFVSEEDIEMFLNNFKLFTGQPNENDLTDIIKNKIEAVYRIERNDMDMIFSDVEYKVRQWWKDQDCYLTESNTFFQDTAKFSFYFDVKLPSELFTGRNRELNDLHQSLQRSKNKVTVISQVTTISGLGGVGKTELARQYIKEYGQYYDNNVIWINADNETNLTGSFLRLAEDKLKILTKTINGEKKSIESITEEVYQFFSTRKSLFVFDNVENYNDIIKTLPLHSLKPDDNRPYVLITSRKREWEKGIGVIDLSVLNITDAIELVKKGLNIQGDSEDNEIGKLVTKLQCFPLAIRQAIAYIDDESLTGDYTISDYLNEFDDNVKDLLNSDLFRGIDNDYAKTTYTTWKITIHKISNEFCGEVALKLLNLMAFMANENISRDMFLSLPNIDEKQLHLSVRLLIKYSMVNGEHKQSILSIHKLVQDVTRLEVSEEQQVINECSLVLKSNFPQGNQNVLDLTKKRQLLPHLETLVCHIDNYCCNDERLEKTETLLNLLNDGYFDFDPRNQKRILERIIKLNKERYGLNSLKTSDAIFSLSEANRMLGDYQSQKESLQQALKIQENLFAVDHIQTAETLTNLAFAYGHLGNPEHQKELLERVAKIRENFYGPDDYHLAIPLTNLGLAYGDLGFPEKQKELLERALKLEESYYGSDNKAIVQTLVKLGNAYGSLGNPSKQKELLERALELDEKYYGSDHCELANILIDIGSAYGRLGEPSKQVDVSERALKLKEKYYGSEHYEVVAVLENLSYAYSDLGDLEKQKEFSERALSIREKHYGVDHIALVRSLNILAHARISLGDPLNHKILLDRVLDIQTKHYVSNHCDATQNLISLGIVHNNLGDNHKQVEYLEQALQFQRKHYISNFYGVAITLAYLGDAYGALGDYQKQKELTEQALQLQEEHYGSDHFTVAKTLVNLSKAYSNLNNPLKQKELLERALSIQERHFVADHIEIGDTLSNLAISYGALGDAQRQKELSERALNIQVNYFGPGHYRSGLTLLNIAVAYGLLNDPKKQKEFLEKALEVYENHYGPNHFLISSILLNLGIAYGNLGEPLKQKEILERALELCEKQNSADQHQIGKTLTVLALVYGSLGDLEGQKQLAERALKICEESYGYDHCETALALSNLGTAYGNLNNYNKQKVLQEEALAIQRKYCGSDSLESAKTLINLNIAYYNLGDFRRQVEILEEALNIYEIHFGSEDIQLTVILKFLTYAYSKLGEFQNLQTVFERMLNIQEHRYGSDHIQLTEVLVKLGRLQKGVGNFQKQKDFVERVLAIQEKHFGPGDCHLIDTLKELAEVCGKLGDQSRENELLERISKIQIRTDGLENSEPSGSKMPNIEH